MARLNFGRKVAASEAAPAAPAAPATDILQVGREMLSASREKQRGAAMEAALDGALTALAQALLTAGSGMSAEEAREMALAWLVFGAQNLAAEFSLEARFGKVGGNAWRAVAGIVRGREALRQVALCTPRVPTEAVEEAPPPTAEEALDSMLRCRRDGDPAGAARWRARLLEINGGQPAEGG